MQITMVYVMHSIPVWAYWTLAAHATVPVRCTSVVAQTLRKETATAKAMNWTLWVYAEGLVQPMRMPMVFAMM
jgi:penicillin V acylase-like amidase (Ntn superfamily)